MLTLDIIFSCSWIKKATSTHLWIIILISHIGVIIVYFDTRDMLSNTNSQIYDKEEHEYVKVVISYKSAFESNTFLFETARPKINHSWVLQNQVAYIYLQAVA